MLSLTALVVRYGWSERCVEQGRQLVGERARPRGVEAAERLQQLLKQLLDHRDGLPRDDLPLLGEGQLHGTRVAGIAGALDQAGRLQGARQFRDVQRLQAGVVGESALTGPLTGTLHAVQRRDQ